MWLLEVNTGPILMETDPLDVALVKDIVDTVVIGDGSPKGGWAELPHATAPTAAAAAATAAAAVTTAAAAVVAGGAATYGAAVAGAVRPGVAKADAEAAAGVQSSCAAATTGTHTVAVVHAPAVSEGVPPDKS